MTGPQGGVWIPLGGAAQGHVGEGDPRALRSQSMPGAGIANVRGIEEGKAQVGFGNSITTVDAHRRATRPSRSRTRRSATSRTSTRSTSRSSCRPNAGINSFADLKGKALATQPSGNTAEIITQHVLKVNGLTYNDVKASFMLATPTPSSR